MIDLQLLVGNAEMVALAGSLCCEQKEAIEVHVL